MNLNAMSVEELVELRGKLVKEQKPLRSLLWVDFNAYIADVDEILRVTDKILERLREGGLL